MEWRGMPNGGGWGRKSSRRKGGCYAAAWRNVLQNQDDKRGVCPVMYGAQIRAIVPITVRIIGDELVRGSAPTVHGPVYELAGQWISAIVVVVAIVRGCSL